MESIFKLLSVTYSVSDPHYLEPACTILPPVFLRRRAGQCAADRKHRIELASSLHLLPVRLS